jgi:hypothetical protein
VGTHILQAAAMVASCASGGFCGDRTRMMLTVPGTTFFFTTYFLAVLAAGLFAGTPAGAFAAVLAMPIVWWAFMPPGL